jgi:hypothetical protein
LAQSTIWILHLTDELHTILVVIWKPPRAMMFI